MPRELPVGREELLHYYERELAYVRRMGAEFAQRIPQTENAFAFVIDGEGVFAGAKAARYQLALFDRGGDTVKIANSGAVPLSFLLIAGEPIAEPVARYGPFVMNSREEIIQAADDFRSGRMGVLA